MVTAIKSKEALHHDTERTEKGGCGIRGTMEGSELRKGTEPAILDGFAGQRIRRAGLYSCVIDTFILF